MVRRVKWQGRHPTRLGKASLLMASSQTGRPRVRGQITPIAWIYVAYGAALCAACLANAEIGQVRLSVLDLWMPAFLIVAALGAIRRKPWGRWSCYLLSALMLLGVPLGTIIGGLMIYHLTVHRDQFRSHALASSDTD